MDREAPPAPPIAKGGGASIVVLPFANLSRDQDSEIVSDELTDELITALSQAGEIRVVARTSALSFKGKAMDIRDIARQLGVRTVLEGCRALPWHRIRRADHAGRLDAPR